MKKNTQFYPSFIGLNIFKKPTARLLSAILFLFNVQLSYHFSFFAELENRGVIEDAIVIITGDHAFSS
jgi:hypothetical protein